MVALVAFALVLTGPLAEAAGEAVGLGSTAVTVWSIAKWPVLALVVSSIFSLLYYSAPNVQQPRFRWFTAGGVLALVVWVARCLAPSSTPSWSAAGSCRPA